MRTCVSLLAALVCLCPAYAQRVDMDVAGESPRLLYLMDKDWRFHRGHLDQPKPKGHHWVYKSVKAGAARGPAAFRYDDGSWRDRRNVFNNYDNHWVDWGNSIRATRKFVDTREWNGGTFIWTGFDYRGEPTPVNAWPAISSYFGIVDTCGFAKDSFYLMQALWTEKPMAHVFPHWNLGEEMIGRKVKVGTYTNGDEVELILNGESLGRRKVDKYMQLFWDDVVYEPGKLEMIAYKDGREHARDAVETTGEAVALGLEVRFDDWQRDCAYAGMSDALPVTVSVQLHASTPASGLTGTAKLQPQRK